MRLAGANTTVAWFTIFSVRKAAWQTLLLALKSTFSSVKKGFLSVKSAFLSVKSGFLSVKNGF